MSFTDIKADFEATCHKAGTEASRRYKRRVMELLSGLSFVDKFEGMLMGMGSWAFHDKDNQPSIPVIYDDGQPSLVEWGDAFDCACERRKVYDLKKVKGYNDLVSLQEIGRILKHITDDPYLKTFDITKEELSAYIKANRKPSRKRMSRGRKADSQDGSPPLARSVLASALR